MVEQPPPRRPPRRPEPRDRTPERVLALAGVSGLLLVFVVSIVLIARARDDGTDGATASATATPTATRTATPTPTAKPKPTPVPLTAAQRAERDQAAQTVESRGFTVTRLRDWDPDDTLRVLIGKTSSGGRLAFFFVQGDYIGNDSSEVSARVRVKRTADLTTTLTYTVAQPSTTGGEPSTSKLDVRFTWDGSRLNPDQELPPASERGPGALPG